MSIVANLNLLCIPLVEYLDHSNSNSEFLRILIKALIGINFLFLAELIFKTVTFGKRFIKNMSFTYKLEILLQLFSVYVTIVYFAGTTIEEIHKMLIFISLLRISRNFNYVN